LCWGGRGEGKQRGCYSRKQSKRAKRHGLPPNFGAPRCCCGFALLYV
jgi:hypothetical protein